MGERNDAACASREATELEKGLAALGRAKYVFDEACRNASAAIERREQARTELQRIQKQLVPYLEQINDDPTIPQQLQTPPTPLQERVGW